jgi:hypothetical protein
LTLGICSHLALKSNFFIFFNRFLDTLPLFRTPPPTPVQLLQMERQNANIFHDLEANRKKEQDVVVGAQQREEGVPDAAAAAAGATKQDKTPTMAQMFRKARVQWGVV